AVPLPRGLAPTSADVARSAPWFPAIGGITGGTLALIAALLGQSGLVPAVTAALVVLAGIALTAGAGELGLARSVERASRPELRDPWQLGRLGAAGVLAIVAVVGLRGVGLAGTGAAHWTAALVTSHVIARWSALLLGKL